MRLAQGVTQRLYVVLEAAAAARGGVSFSPGPLLVDEASEVGTCGCSASSAVMSAWTQAVRRRWMPVLGTRNA
jgi:hypothetical protein